MGKKTGKKVAKVTDIKKTVKPSKGKEEPKKTIADRLKELEAELEKTANFINGLQARLNESQKTFHNIQGAIVALKEFK